MSQKITIISVGNTPSTDLMKLLNEYTKRLPKHLLLNWRYIKHSPGDAESSKRKESENILKATAHDNFVVLLDETGKQLTSPQLSHKIFAQPRDTTFIIGGAYGVSDQVRDRADFVWSLSQLVFPHQLVRLLLAEQLYRAYAISTNHPYHHE